MWKNIKRIDDASGVVAKYVFEAKDAVVESVLYRYPDYKTRTVICCSVMSGCPVGCRFCGTGEYFVKNLSGDQIVSQVEHCLADTGIDPNEINRLQIMTMSMGEPMLNQKALSEAFRKLYKAYPKAALLVSTSGPDVDYSEFTQLSCEIPTIGLQFSVHKSTDEERNKLIPFKKKLNLSEIAMAGEYWYAVTGRNPFFNYCAGPDNSSIEDADRLAELFDPMIWNATVSVICERSEDVCASNNYQRRLATDFANLLVERGFNTRTFDPAGQDTIGGGCGQLHFIQKWMREHPELALKSVGYGKPEVHTPIFA